MVMAPNVGMPKFGTKKSTSPRQVSIDGRYQYLPGGGIIDGTKTRNAFNTAITSTDTTPFRDLWSGLLMGRVTSTGKWANSFFGYSNGALTNSGTTLTLASAAHAVELVRRQGATGTFTLTGPPTAAGTVRTLTATYSAVDTTTGEVTITALGVNEVQTITFNAAATGGNIALRVPMADGTMEVTALAAWNATDATYLAAIQTALDNATGVANGIVVSGAAPDTALTFTFSGTGYAGLNHAPIEVVTYPTTPTHYTNVETTAGVDGRFVTASLVGGTDGSQVPLSFLPDEWGEFIPDDSSDVPFSRVPVHAFVKESQLLYWPADTSLRQWIRDKLNVAGTFRWYDLLAG